MFAFGFTHLFQFYFGRLADRFGPKKMILSGGLILGVCLLLMSQVTSFWWLLVILFIYGTGGSFWNVAAWSMMSKIGEEINKEGQVVSCYISFSKIGAVLMSLVAGFIVVRSSIPFLFLIAGILILLGVFLSWLLLKPSSIQAKEKAA
jgi:MFS family permease